VQADVLIDAPTSIQSSGGSLFMCPAPGTVTCRWCQLTVNLPAGHEIWLLGGRGWRFEEGVDEWICPTCIDRRSNGEAN
jgi:hypothetical protein